VYKVGGTFVCWRGSQVRRGGICGLVEGDEIRDTVCTKESLKHSERLTMCGLSDYDGKQGKLQFSNKRC
jgi:hypothetical protein